MFAIQLRVTTKAASNKSAPARIMPGHTKFTGKPAKMWKPSRTRALQSIPNVISATMVAEGIRNTFQLI